VLLNAIRQAGHHDGSELMTTRRLLLAQASGAAAALAVPRWLLAQDFPSRSIDFIVPYPAGGSADVLARMVAQHMGQRWSQRVIVLNKPGGGTVIGVGQAAKAAPDGHTILFISNSFVINAKLRKNLPYDGLRAFEPVALMVNSPQVIAVNSSSPYGSLAQLLDAARARPATLSIGTLGPATTQHIAAELLQRTTGVKLVYVPFTGGGPAVIAALGGHIDAVLANYGEVAAHLESSKLRPLAVTTAQRLDKLANVPTVAELGYPAYEAVAWFGVAAPAGTPAAIVARLSDGIAAAMADSEIRRSVDQQSLQPAVLGPKAFAAHIAAQYERYSRVIDEAGIQPE
jgi:tripartite-type tricarboxylate transporter receptor subunit TctC